jgi:hypothetical protein
MISKSQEPGTIYYNAEISKTDSYLCSSRHSIYDRSKTLLLDDYHTDKTD